SSKPGKRRPRQSSPQTNTQPPRSRLWGFSWPSVLPSSGLFLSITPRATMKRTYHIELWHWDECQTCNPLSVIGEYQLADTAFQVATGILAGAFDEYTLKPTGEIWILSGTELLATVDQRRSVEWKCQFLGHYYSGRLAYAGNDLDEAERAASQDHVSGR